MRKEIGKQHRRSNLETTLESQNLKYGHKDKWKRKKQSWKGKEVEGFPATMVLPVFILLYAILRYLVKSNWILLSNWEYFIMEPESSQYISMNTFFFSQWVYSLRCFGLVFHAATNIRVPLSCYSMIIWSFQHWYYGSLLSWHHQLTFFPFNRIELVGIGQFFGKKTDLKLGFKII